LNDAVGFLEVNGWSPGMVILDTMEKAATVRLLQAELNDRPGVCLKITGSVADVAAAIQAGEAMARSMEVECITDVIARPDPRSTPAYEAKPDYNPLMEQATVHLPTPPAAAAVPPSSKKKRETQPKEKQPMSTQAPFAVGLIETQGFTAVFEAIDTAVKTANVEVLAREKLGGGYITVMIKGDVAAVRAAVDAGKAKVEGLGRLVAAHVIPSPSEAVLSLIPK
jgi:carbon dioxide concentrating mechanism protein CcmO